ncbi:unnamed protein product [Durusdinium trenchii]|uniref:Uncharacterized protein n=2 Tax=Durusdinium trenchii TaxID=1381693 RepID=A0ABP0SG08_9DINO
MANTPELESVLSRRREEVEARGAFYTKDRCGRADAVWYERTEGQFSPRHSDRPVSRLASASPFPERDEPAEAPRQRPHLVRRRSAPKQHPEPDRVRRSFPRRVSTGTALKAPVRPMNSRNTSPMASSARSLATPERTRAAASEEGSHAATATTGHTRCSVDADLKDVKDVKSPAAKRSESSSSAGNRRQMTSSQEASTISCEAIPPPPAPKSVSQRAPVDQKGENADSRVGPQGKNGPSASALPQLSRPPKAGAAVQTNKAADESPCDAGGCSEAVQDPGGLQDGSSKGDQPEDAQVESSHQEPGTMRESKRHVRLSTVESSEEGPGFSKPVPALESPQDERSRSTACGSKRHVRLATAESSEEGPGEKPQKKAQEDSSPEEAGEPIDSPFRSVATGVSSWRQLSLGSLSSQGLPTILTHISESKKGMWVDEEEEEPLPSPKAEPEPAPSPNCEAAWQGGAGGQSGLPAPLVISIPPGHGDAKDNEPPKLDERDYRMLWEAVVQGHVSVLQQFMARGLLQSGCLCDMNGHSIFWNALAYQQQQVAMFLLQHFPPGTPEGIDLMEIHARRKDTLLHLCVYFEDFSGPAAELFKSLFLGMGQMHANPLQAWSRANADSETFLHCAAARRNFWVMRFVASHAWELLFQQSVRANAIQVLLEKLEEVGVVRPAAAAPDVEVPQTWMNFAQYLPHRAERGSAFADVELEVQESSTCYRSIAAHRCVLGAASGIFHQQLLECPSGRSILISPLSCRSWKVLDTALTFIYSSRISCDFSEDGFLLWQLLCLCSSYQLPEPLWRYARSALLRVLVDSTFAVVTPLLLEARDEVGLSDLEACFAAHTFLQSPEVALRSCEQPQALLTALGEIERQAMSMATKEDVPLTSGGPPCT